MFDNKYAVGTQTYIFRPSSIHGRITQSHKPINPNRNDVRGAGGGYDVKWLINAPLCVWLNRDAGGIGLEKRIAVATIAQRVFFRPSYFVYGIFVVPECDERVFVDDGVRAQGRKCRISDSVHLFGQLITL